MISFKEFCNESEMFEKKVQELLVSENQYPYSLVDDAYAKDRIDIWINELGLFDKNQEKAILKYVKDISIKNIDNLPKDNKYKQYLEDIEDYNKLPKFPWKF